MEMLFSFLFVGRSYNIKRTSHVPSKCDEYRKELKVGFLTNGSCFVIVLEGPASAISETTKQYLLNRGRFLSGGIFAHPTAKP
jgi:hypothetical protein